MQEQMSHLQTDFVKEWIGQQINSSGIKTAEIINGVPEGQRNNSAASVAGKLLAKFGKESWELEVWPLMQGWNSKNQPKI